jgi:hypothetical protein
MEVLASILVLGVLAPALAVVSLRYRILPFLRKTYFFWTIFSLANFGFLFFLAFPPLLLLHPRWVARFGSFLLPPLGIAGAAALTTFGLWLLLRRRLRKRVVEVLGPYVVNAVFLLAFLSAADAHKSNLIQQALALHSPQCVYVRSFWESLRVAGNSFYAHAVYVENGCNFYWSYADLAFFPGHDRLDRNFPCPER